MKKIILSLVLAIMVFSSCKVNQHMPLADDMYADPAEEKRIARIQDEQRLKKQKEEQAAKEAEYLAQKAKDDANPYYHEPIYGNDDYYDYAYASRFRRFHNPVMGAGYYDNYYTNAYWYNQNPNFYGTSIYNSYNWWTPSSQFGMYYGNVWNNPYCMNTWGMGYGFNAWNNPYGFNSFAYQPWGYSFWNNPWNNPWNGGGYYGSNWGYFNSFDLNSNYTYAPRQGNNGSNSTRGSYAGMAIPNGLSSERQMFFNSITEKQESTPKFTANERKTIFQNSESFNEQPINIDPNFNGRQSVIKNNENNGINSNYPTRSSGMSNSGNTNGGGRNVINQQGNNTALNPNSGINTLDNNPSKIMNGRNQSGGKNLMDHEGPTFSNPSNTRGSSIGGGSFGGGSGGGSISPRGGSGGSSRPR